MSCRLIHRPLQRVNAAKPGEPTRQLAALRIVAWLALIAGISLLVVAWQSGLIEAAAQIIRGAK